MSLRTVIEAYSANLPPGDLEHFRVDALDRIGVPVVFACHRQSDGAQFDAFGYGATEEQALVGVLGELTENAQADTVLQRDDLLIVSGPTEVVERFAAETAD